MKARGDQIGNFLKKQTEDINEILAERLSIKDNNWLKIWTLSAYMFLRKTRIWSSPQIGSGLWSMIDLIRSVSYAGGQGHISQNSRKIVYLNFQNSSARCPRITSDNLNMVCRFVLEKKRFGPPHPSFWLQTPFAVNGNPYYRPTESIEHFQWSTRKFMPERSGMVAEPQTWLLCDVSRQEHT